MRLPAFLWLVPVIVLSAGGATAMAAPTPAAPTTAPATPPTAVPSAENEALARKAVEQLAARKFDAVAKQFDEQMTKALPAKKLGTVWDQLVAQAGAFQSIERVASEMQGDMNVVHVVCKFANAEVELAFAIDSQHRIAGLHALPAGAGAEWKPPDYAQPESFDERTITVGSAPWTLRGALAMPKGTGPFPAVVLVQGSGPQDQDESIGPNKPFKDLAWGLASRGVAVVRYDKRTKQYAEKIGENLAGVTVKEETIDDARAAVDLAAKTPGIDPHRIVVLGHSLGGYLAPRIAKGDAQVAGLVILAGSTRPLEDLLIEQLKHQASLTPEPPADLKQAIADAERAKRKIEDPNLKPGSNVEILGSPLPASYFLDLRDYHPAEMAAGLAIPMLILQGERDAQVSMVDFEGWKKALGKRGNVTLKSYPTLNHLFIPGSGPASGQEYLEPGHVAPEVVDEIANWVVKTAGKGKG